MNTTTTQTVSLENFLKFSACIIRLVGYVSNTTAKESGAQSTATLAWEWSTKGRPDILRAAVLLPEDKVTSAQTIAWLKELDGRGNDYLFKIAEIGHKESIEQRESGFAASAITAMHKAQKSSAPSATGTPTGDFVGKVGDKINLLVTYVRSSSFSSAYGLCHKHVFEGINLENIAWLTSKDADELKITAGTQYTLKATVKKHSTYKSRQETEVSRATLS